MPFHTEEYRLSDLVEIPVKPGESLEIGDFVAIESPAGQPGLLVAAGDKPDLQSGAGVLSRFSTKTTSLALVHRGAWSAEVQTTDPVAGTPLAKQPAHGATAYWYSPVPGERAKVTADPAITNHNAVAGRFHGAGNGDGSWVVNFSQAN